MTDWRAIDDATVAMLRASTPRGYLARNDADERLGVDPYTNPPAPRQRDPRALFLFCAECDTPFWWEIRGGMTRRFCSDNCRSRQHMRLRWRRLHGKAA